MKRHRILVLAVIFLCLSLIGGVGYGYAASTGATLSGGNSLSVRCSGASLAWSQVDGVDGVASCAPTTTTTSAQGGTAQALAASYSEASGFPVYAGGTGLASVKVTPKAVGDLVVLFVELHSGSGLTVTGLSSSNVTWSAAPAAVNDDSSVPLHVELWYGKATSTATAATSVRYSGSVSSNAIEVIADEFHANSAGSWAMARGGLADSSAATVGFPSLSSTSRGGIYVGYSRVASSYMSCNSAGFKCWGTPTANVELRDVSLAASTVYSPTPLQSVSSEYTSTAAVFYLAGSSTTTTSPAGVTTSSTSSTTSTPTTSASSSTTSPTSPTSTSSTTSTTTPTPPPTGGTGGNCTNPIYTTSDPTGTTSLDSSGYWWVNNDAWSGGHGPQTLYACSASSWYAASNQPNIGGAVETYPDTEYDIGGRDSGTTKTIAQYGSITSTFSEAFPSAGGWDAAYDLWLNNWGTEIMIWNEWAGGQSYWPQQASIAVTLDGVPYHFYNNGGELMFFRDTEVKSGSVDILAAFRWLVSQGLVKSTDIPTQLEYGVEVCYTSGTGTFPVTGLTFGVS